MPNLHSFISLSKYRNNLFKRLTNFDHNKIQLTSKGEMNFTQKEDCSTSDSENKSAATTTEFPTQTDVRSNEENATSANSKHSKNLLADEKSNKCRFDIHCKRKDCFFDHPNGRLIDQTDSTDVAEKKLSKDELIRLIEELLLKADEYMNSKPPKETQTIDDDDDDEYDYSDQSDDEEPILDIVKNHTIEQFKLQRHEFRTMVVSLHELFESHKEDNYELLQDLCERLQREMRHWKTLLPIYSRRTDIVELIRKHQIFILKADTGSGKSTQVVQYLCDAGFAQEKQILCTQPRKLAAYALATRIAKEYGCELGQEVGYYVGGRRPESTSERTKIKFITDTILLKEYQKDPLLKNYSVVIIDEAHERKIDTDLALGIMKQCLKRREDLKVIVMSATLDMALLENYFSNLCGKLEIGGRTYPIEDSYLDDDLINYVQASVAKAVDIHKKQETGDILVFLTGQEEIGLAINELKQQLRDDKHYEALSLHGNLPEEESEYIFKKIPGKRKIIFSTNVAETSITIDGIQHVIDSGMVKTKMWDSERKMQVLKIGPITQSSVKQRRGRAGRTSPGKCYHLYTVATYESMDPCSPAEILCTQPLLAILKLKSLGIRDINSFQWIEPPSARDLEEAHETLSWLNALDEQGELTDLGNEMVLLGIDPRLTAMLRKAKELECLSEVLIIAGMLTVSQNIWWRGKGEVGKREETEARERFSHERGDHITFLCIYQKWNDFSQQERKAQYDWCQSNYVNAKSLQIANIFIEEVCKQMNYEMTMNQDLNEDLIDRILQCITAGYFQNLAVSNGPLRAGYRVIPAFQSDSKKLTVRVLFTSALALKNQMPQYILYNELVNLNGINYITTLSSIDPAWLHSVSQQWYQSADIGKIHLITYESFTFTDVTWALMRAVVGKHNCKLNMINEAIQGVVEVDYSDVKLTIWCPRSNLDNAKEIMEKMLEKERQRLCDEQEEFEVVGRTRIVMGNGGETKMVLVGNECIRIILTMLPATITEDRIKELCSPYGRVRDISFLEQTSKGTCVAVSYYTSDEAQCALKKLNCHVEQGRKISVGGAHLKSDALIGKQDFSLRAVWYLTHSLKNGKIIFTDENDALTAYRLFAASFYQCRYERSDDLPKLEVTYYRGLTNRAEVKFQAPKQVQEAVKQMQYTMLGSKKINCARGQDSKGNPFIKVTNLPGDTDEEDIRDHFKSCAGILEVVVIRKPNSTKFNTENAKNEIMKIFKNYQMLQENSLQIKNFPQEKTVAYVTFSDGEKLQSAIQDMNGKPGIIGSGKIRLKGYVNKKKTKGTEYVIHFQDLDSSVDKYDLMRILKENQLYNYAKNILVRRQKWKNTATTQTSDFGLAALRKKFDECKDFRSAPTYHLRQPTSDGIVVAYIFFDDPADVVTSIHTFKKTEIRLSGYTSNLRLIPSMAHEILVHPALVEAIPDQIQQAVGSIKEEFRNQLYIKVYRSTTDNASMKVTIDGDNIEQIREAKMKLETILRGKEYIWTDHPEKIQIVFDRAGKDALIRIQKETGSYIWWNIPNSFIRLFGSDEACELAREKIDEYIKCALIHEKHTITMKIPACHWTQIRGLTSTNQEFVEKKNDVKLVFLLLPHHQIRLTGIKSHVLECENMINKWLETFSSSDDSSSTLTAECAICLNKFEYRLQACGHPYCYRCLQTYLSNYFSGVQVRIKCPVDNCGSLLLLCDVKTILRRANDMRRLINASFEAYIKTDEDLIHCPGDKEQVFRKSKHPLYFSCDHCLKTYCVKCNEEYHPDWTCEQNKAFAIGSGKEEFLNNIGNMNVKFCPNSRCKQPCWKDGDCNEVKCGCGTHFCWLCLFNDSKDVHYHFRDEKSKCYMKLGFKE